MRQREGRPGIQRRKERDKVVDRSSLESTRPSASRALAAPDVAGYAVYLPAYSVAERGLGSADEGARWLLIWLFNDLAHGGFAALRIPRKLYRLPPSST